MIIFTATIPADLTAMSGLRKEVSGRLDALRPSKSLKQAVLLTLAEIVANAIRHGCPKPTAITVRLRVEGLTLSIEIEDDGGPFTDFEAYVARSMLTDMASMAEGGRGLGIVRSMLDDMRYTSGTPNLFIGTRGLRRSRPSILIIEDSQILLETYAAMLSTDYRVFKASSLEAAIDLTRHERVDGIVTDLHLEGREGTELVSILEEDPERPPVPILVITGDRDDGVNVRASLAGVEQVLPKPVSIQTLRNAVAAMLVRSARQNAKIFRYFGQSVDIDGQDTLPERVGPFSIRAISAKAGFGRGDFLCALKRQTGIRLVLADVMGHGLEAQIAGIQFRAAIRALHAQNPDSPCETFVQTISKTLCTEPIAAGSMFTFAVADLEPGGLVRLVTAGHPRAIALTSGHAQIIETDGPLPGIFPEITYQAACTMLKTGDRLFLLTDGIDPRAADAGQSAPQWVLDAIEAGRDAPIETAMSRLEEAVKTVLSHSPIDDWTVLAIDMGG